MKAAELRDSMIRLLRHDDREQDDVVIETKNGGIGSFHMTGIKQIVPGLDWTDGKIILIPTEPLVVARVLDKPVCAFARERLEQMKETHRLLGHKDSGKAREQAWIDGFEAGLLAHVTSCVEAGKR